jgi:hypothetical protein
MTRSSLAGSDRASRAEYASLDLRGSGHERIWACGRTRRHRRELDLCWLCSAIARKMSRSTLPIAPYRPWCLAKRFDSTFGFADAAVNALVWIKYEHVLALVEAIDRANWHTIHMFAFDAGLCDYERHLFPPVMIEPIQPRSSLAGCPCQRSR